MQRQAANSGFTLIELMIGVSLAAVLTTGVVQLALATERSYRAQQSIASLQENARLALDALGEAIAAAGYRPEPWVTSTAIDALSELSMDSLTAWSDRIVMQRWSDRNCFGNWNPDEDGEGKPRFYLKETGFFVNGSKNLAQSCRYGPDAGQMTTQINNMGLAQNTESCQVMYAKDSDADGNADRWVHAGQWGVESDVMAVRVALLLATPEALVEPDGQAIQVLEQTIQPPADGRERRVFESVFDIGARL